MRRPRRPRRLRSVGRDARERRAVVVELLEASEPHALEAVARAAVDDFADAVRPRQRELHPGRVGRERDGRDDRFS